MNFPQVVLCVPNVPRRPDNTNRLYTLGLLYLKNAAEQVGWKAHIIDAYFHHLNVTEIVQRLIDLGTIDVIGFTLNSREMLDEAIKIIKNLYQHNIRPRVIVGGFYVSLCEEKLQDEYPEIDYAVSGEGEKALQDFLRGQRGDSRRVKNLDELGDLNFTHPDITLSQDEYSLVTSRGCSAACSYCPIGPHWGRYREWRGHSAQWIVRHMERLVIEHQAAYIQFVDDQFIGPPESVKRAQLLADMLMDKSWCVPFYIMSRADTVVKYPEVFKSLQAAGLDTVFLGLESGNQESLDLWRKEATLSESLKSVELLDQMKIKVAAGTIIFHPEMTHRSILKDIDFLRTLLKYDHFTFYGLNELDILSGTPISKQYKNTSWMLDWKAKEPSVQKIYEDWRVVQTLILFPAIRVLPIARNLKIRRAICEWQLDALEHLVYKSKRLEEVNLPSMLQKMTLLVIELMGGETASYYLTHRAKLLQSDTDHISQERCFD